jgi:hypothetical protein
LSCKLKFVHAMGKNAQSGHPVAVFLLIKLTRSTFNQVNPHQQRFISDLPVKTR